MGHIPLPDPYEYVERIGAGGFGSVVKAWEPPLERYVAIKFIREDARDDGSDYRLLDEACRVGRLHHPNIVTVFTVDEFDDSVFLVMEYAVGGTIADRLALAGALPVADALRYVDHAAAGLEYAHGLGTVHQDVKPANLLIDEHDMVKVADFGLARDSDHSTATRGGTDIYAPLECWEEGVPRSSATDVFSLAVTAWEMLTGAPHGGMPRVVREGAVPSTHISDQVPNASRAVDAVFAQALQLEPGNRTQSTVAFATDLRRAFDGDKPSVFFAPRRKRARAPRSLSLLDDGLSLLDGPPAATGPSPIRDAASITRRHESALVESDAEATFMGVKWSAAARPKTSEAGIWIGVMRGGSVVDVRSDFDHDEALDYIIAQASIGPRATVGIDVGFSVPAWYIDERGWTSGTQLWDHLHDVEREAGTATPWPSQLETPFWGPEIRDEPILTSNRGWFRQTERAITELTNAEPKSVFQLTGKSTVGGQSVRAMPRLRRLRELGWNIWPFDTQAGLTVIEVFPKAMLSRLVTPELTPTRDDVRAAVLAALPSAFAEDDRQLRHMLDTDLTAFEVVFTAWSMWTDGPHLPDLTGNDIAQREGRIWMPE